MSLKCLLRTCSPVPKNTNKLGSQSATDYTRQRIGTIVDSWGLNCVVNRRKPENTLLFITKPALDRLWWKAVDWTGYSWTRITDHRRMSSICLAWRSLALRPSTMPSPVCH